ncbi:hypothetical protein WJ87_11610 [Burkholderia ubonensis]|nr:hypothetical protein WJ87_11610 [Burkholderia ubonensis]
MSISIIHPDMITVTFYVRLSRRRQISASPQNRKRTWIARTLAIFITDLWQLAASFSVSMKREQRWLHDQYVWIT